MTPPQHSTHLYCLRREEGRQYGPQPDVLHAQGQQRQQHRNRLLLKPRDVQGEGQAVDVRLEGLGQLLRRNAGEVCA